MEVYKNKFIALCENKHSLLLFMYCGYWKKIKNIWNLLYSQEERVIFSKGHCLDIKLYFDDRLDK